MKTFSTRPSRAAADTTGLRYEINDKGGVTITKYTGAAPAVAIPAAIEGLAVTTIEDEAFSGCVGLRSVTIPSSVTHLGEWAFLECGLTGITIPGSVTSIGEGAFAWCPGLTGIAVANENTAYTGIDGVLFTKNKTTLVAYPTGRNGDYTIPHSVTRLGNYTFAGCAGLTNITIPHSVTSIGEAAFSRCPGLVSVTFPNSILCLGEKAFSGCAGIKSVTFPGSITRLEGSVFEGCTGLKSVTIPGSVTSVREGAFEECTGITSVTIPDSVEYIGDWAFDGCAGLKAVTLSRETRVESGAFPNGARLTYRD